MTTSQRRDRMLMTLPLLLGLACSEPGGDGFPSIDSASAGVDLTGVTTAETAGDPPADSTSTTDDPGAVGSTSGATGDGSTTASTSGAPTPDDPPSDDSPSADSTTEGSQPDGSTSGDPASTGDATTDGGDPEPAPMPDGDDKPAPLPPANATDENLLVALVGDQGTGSDTRAVYKLIKDEGADMLILTGDFDYKDDADLWASEMDGVLGDSFPVFAAIGNHDVQAWKKYRPKLEQRLAKIDGATCTGDELGIKSSCKYRGLHFVLSGIGTKGSDSDHEKFIEQSLAADDSLWSLCVWHKNMRDLQAGDKPDDVTWKALQTCQNDGSIVVMGHEHSYSRTRTLTDLGNDSASHGATGMPELLEVGPGSTFSAVSGLGGKGIRAYDSKLHDGQPWWATIYTSNYHLRNGEEVKSFDAEPGVMFVRFHVGGDPNAAHGYFKNIKNQTIDEFDIVRK